MASMLSLALLFGLLVPGGLAGPACAEKHKTASDCMLRCNLKWGFPGSMMGTDPWGSVMHQGGDSDDAWNNYLAQACGQETTTSSTVTPTSTTATAAATKLIHQGLGTQSVSSTSSSSTSTSSRFTSSRLTTSTTTRSTTSTSSTHTTTSSSKAQLAKVTQPAPAPTTHTTAAAATHTTQASNSNSNSNSDSNSNSNSNSDSNSNSNSNTNGANSGNSGSSSSSSGGNGSRASNADKQAYLDAHNSIRSQHGAVDVTWSNAAAEKAQEWADKCLNKHSGGTLGPLGENLAAGTGSYSIAEAVKDWTDEVSEYNANNPQPSHFTQVVWKATTQIGCAVQTCDGIFAGFGAAQYYVCEYSVQGNVIGNFGANVQA